MLFLSDYQNSVSRHEMWNGGHSCMKCTPWITSFKNSGWRYRYLSTKANVILLVSWPAKSTSKMLSLMSSTLMKLPSSFGVVSKMERRSWLTEAFPSFKSCTQNSSCHFQIDWSHRLNPSVSGRKIAIKINSTPKLCTQYSVSVTCKAFMCMGLSQNVYKWSNMKRTKELSTSELELKAFGNCKGDKCFFSMLLALKPPLHNS